MWCAEEKNSGYRCANIIVELILDFCNDKGLLV